MTRTVTDFIPLSPIDTNTNHHTEVELPDSAMASPLKPIFHQTPSMRLLCHRCRQRFLPTFTHRRLLTTRDDLLAQLDDLKETPNNSSKIDFAKSVTEALGVASAKALGPRNPTSNVPAGNESPAGVRFDPDPDPPPHHLHVFSTKHNCHITLTDGKLQPLISVSSGNIGFRKAARGSYEAAFQLGAYVMGRIDKQGLIKDIHAIEIILRDFGPGREAFTKILLGADGKIIRDRVVRVMDSTKLKFGGTRSKKPRRL